MFGGFIGEPHLLSMSSSNTSLFLISTGLQISSTFSGLNDLLGTTLIYALSIHWTISFPAPLAGPSTLPRTSLLLGKAIVCSLK